MKKNYEMPVIEILEVSNEDIIMNSVDLNFDELLGLNEQGE